MSRELRVPADIIDNPQSSELLRVWTVSDGGNTFVLRPDILSDPAEWGLILVDVAKHAALALSQHSGLEPGAVLQRIREGFDAEWEHPTDPLSS